MRILLFCLCLLPSWVGYAFNLRPDAPSRYEVQRGDTLWGIANRYLTEPWQWKALWHANPQIKNPNHLYPGAIIELHYYKQKPYLRVLTNGTVKLSPYARVMPEENPVTTIPLSDLKPFLNGTLVLDHDSLKNAPFIVAFMTEHMLGGQGDEVYVKDLCPPHALPRGKTLSYGIYRRSGIYRDVNQNKGKFLGYKAVLVGYGELVRGGDPATILLTDIIQGVKLKDRVMPNNHPDFDLYFEPKTPDMPVQGSIIDVLGDFEQGAVGLVTVVNRGHDAGLQAGDVLAIYSRPRRAKNLLYHYSKKAPCQFPCVKLPPERIGEVLIFRTFTHTSIGLVVRSIRAIHLLDIVTSP